MKLDKSYFFCGIGGSGMLPLALIVQGRGGRVAGSDRALDQAKSGDKFVVLRAQGIELFPQDGTGVTSAEQIVIASAAVEESVPDIVKASALGCRRMTRAELLAELFNAAPLGIAVGGTSGKSTVTGMIGWILTQAGRDPTIMNGAVMRNFGSGARLGATGVFVSEVDESDGSIALYRPKIAVLNNVSVDHKPIEELRALFGAFLSVSDIAIVNAEDREAAALIPACAGKAEAPARDTFSCGLFPWENVVQFSLGAPADFDGTGIIEKPDGVEFTISNYNENRSVRAYLAVPGRHNVANAVAAVAAACLAGVRFEQAVLNLATYAGLARRLEVVGTAGGVTVIDDFAHNPDKLAATLRTLHTFPGRLLLFFQPHGFGPLRTMGSELANTFAEEMTAEDVLLMPDPVYHGGTTDKSIGSAVVTDAVAAHGRQAEHLATREACGERLLALALPGDRIVVMGARDDTLTTFAEGLIEGLGRAA